VVRVLGRAVLLPAWTGSVPAFALGTALLASLALRLSRRRLGSSPEALADNTWAVLGLIPSTLAACALAAAWLLRAPLDGAALRVGLSMGAAALVWGHLRLVDPGRRLSVGRTTRDAVAGILTLGLTALAVVVARPLWPSGPLPLGAAVVGTLLLALALHRALRIATRALLAPQAGRLLQALAAGHVRLAETRSLPDLGRIALGAAREASADPTAEPVLHVFDPELELRIDAAGQPHLAPLPIHPQILARLREQPGEIILRAPLEAQLVRKPVMRPLAEAVIALDALCIVPLTLAGELEGALVVPRGRRRAALNLEELEALHRFANHVAGYLSVLAASERAQARVGELLAGRNEAHRALGVAREELERLGAEARALRAGGSLERVEAETLAYSDAMRAFWSRLRAASAVEVPVWLAAERGIPVLGLSRELHVRGSRADAPWVVAACGQVRREDAELALFGDGTAAHPGWLRMAAAGVLVLQDLPALPQEVQARLVEAVRSGRAQPLGDGAPYAVRARVVATARRSISELLAGEGLLPELGELFPVVLPVPPLRERAGDLPSLTLIELDRASRVLGRATVGIAPDAQARLDAHDWPGNHEELAAVVEQAVARADGPRVTLADLPSLGGASGHEGDAHPLEGSFESVEGRVLARALERAGGNKSEAARLLGLKRTTFLDKLRRHGLDPGARLH
jgi:DNA-binding NtrC family response regulator